MKEPIVSSLLPRPIGHNMQAVKLMASWDRSGSYFSVLVSPPLEATETDPSLNPHWVAAEAALDSARIVVASEKRIVCVDWFGRCGAMRELEAKEDTTRA